jgi:hypothetical protein
LAWFRGFFVGLVLLARALRGWGWGGCGLGGDGLVMGYRKGIGGALMSLAGPGRRWRIGAMGKGSWLCAERTTKSGRS